MCAPCCRTDHSALVLALLLCGLVSVWAAKGVWHPARATYFDSPQYWKDSFEPGKFGDLYGNSCQYLNRKEGVKPSNDGFPLPFDGVGAVTDAMAAHVGKEQELPLSASIPFRPFHEQYSFPFLFGRNGMLF